MLNPREGGRLDAKRHYVILAKALDGVWPVGHVAVALCPTPPGLDLEKTSLRTLRK